MLREIHIRNYAVVESLSLEFFPGLNLLSGETGSGKSILVDALGLALGGRASADIVRTGQDRATITAVFESQTHAPWKSWLEEYGLDGGEREIILRREIQAEGKSRLLVNDQPVTLASMRSLSRRLVDIHGQNEHVALLARDAQLELLDQFAQMESLLEKVAELFRRRRALEREMETLSQNEQERLRAMDLLQFQAQELERARLEPGEDTRLEQEKSVLANVEKVRSAVSAAFAQLYEEEGSAFARLSLVTKALYEGLHRYDAAAELQIESLNSARAAVEDVSAFLRDYLEKLEADPQRLEEVENRLAEIDRLKRKYGKTIEDILSYAERTAEQLSTLEHADERRTQAARELEKANAEYDGAAQELSSERRAAAKMLEKKVRQELAQLGMEKARFEIHFLNSPDAPGGLRGKDEIEIRISANLGEEARALERTASGGELSRLMLALKTVVAENPGKDSASSGSKQTGAAQGWLRTFIFDEVDAGIGGRVAECVGQRLKRLAEGAQVLCVTHLPQIACFADHHYYVEKFERGGRTITEVRQLTGEKERAAELARMLSGSHITDAVLQHAAAMLKQAR